MQRVATTGGGAGAAAREGASAGRALGVWLCGDGRRVVADEEALLCFAQAAWALAHLGSDEAERRSFERAFLASLRASLAA